MLAVAFPLVAVPACWYLLGLAGAALRPARASPVDAMAALRGAAVLILATWVGTRTLGLSGRWSLAILLGAVAGVLVWRAARACLHTVVVPGASDLPILALGTVLLTVWAAPVSRHGLGSIATGNHADLPSYLLQAGYLMNHGLDPAGLPGIEPAQRMFDAFGASALLAPTTAVPAAPTIGVMLVLMVGAVLLAQIVERVSRRALDGRRVAPVLLGATLLLSWAFTFNGFAYFLAQVWGLAFGMGLLALLIEGERGLPAVLDGALLSAAGVLTYNPTGALYAATAIVAGAWLTLGERRARRPWASSPGVATLAGVAAGAVAFGPMWHQALERVWILRDVVAGWPIPTAPLWIALGLPSADAGHSVPAILAGSLALAAVAAAGWVLRGGWRARAARWWPLGLPVAFWVAQAVRDPGTYAQWKAFSYAQPLLVVGLGCGLVLVTDALASRVRANRDRRPAAAIAVAVCLALAVVSGWNAFWPRTYFDGGGCCIATREQIDQLRAAGAQGTGSADVATGSLWASDVAAAVVSLDRPVTVAPPSIWPAAATSPPTATITFDTGTNPTLVEGRFVLTPAVTPPG